MKPARVQQVMAYKYEIEAVCFETCRERGMWADTVVHFKPFEIGCECYIMTNKVSLDF